MMKYGSTHQRETGDTSGFDVRQSRVRHTSIGSLNAEYLRLRNFGPREPDLDEDLLDVPLAATTRQTSSITRIPPLATLQLPEVDSRSLLLAPIHALAFVAAEAEYYAEVGLRNIGRAGKAGGLAMWSTVAGTGGLIAAKVNALPTIHPKYSAKKGVYVVWGLSLQKFREAVVLVATIIIMGGVFIWGQSISPDDSSTTANGTHHPTNTGSTTRSSGRANNNVVGSHTANPSTTTTASSKATASSTLMTSGTHHSTSSSSSNATNTTSGSSGTSSTTSTSTTAPGTGGDASPVNSGSTGTSTTSTSSGTSSGGDDGSNDSNPVTDLLNGVTDTVNDVAGGLVDGLGL